VKPARSSLNRDIFRWPVPRRANTESGKPKYPPPQLRIYIAGEKSHEKWLRTARYYESRSLASHQSMPEDSAFAGIQFDITKCRPWQPCTVEKSLEDSGHTHPPNRMEYYKVIAAHHCLLESLEVRLELLHSAVSMVQDGVELHFADIESLYRVASVARSFFIRAREIIIESHIVGMPEK